MWKKFAALVVAGVLVAGCGDTRGEQALTGAGAGALGAAAVGGDVTTGAVVGGGAGWFCRELGICL